MIEPAQHRTGHSRLPAAPAPLLLNGGDRSRAWRRRLWSAFALTVLSFLALATVTRCDLAVVHRTALAVGLGGLGLVLVLYLVVSLARALRVWVLLGRRHPLRDLTAVSFQHYLFATFLPLRLGELSFLVLLRRRGVRMARSLPTLALARIGDAIAIGAIFLLALPFVGEMSHQLAGIRLLVWALELVLAVTVVCTVVWHRRVIVSLRLLLRRRRSWRMGRRLSTGLADISRGLADLTPPALAATLVLSLLIWLVSIAYVWVLVARAALPLSFAEVAVSTCLTVLVGLQPIQGWANLGTHELSTVVVWGWFGVAADDAFGLSLLTHVMVLGCVVVLGLAGWLTPMTASDPADPQQV